MYCPRCGIANYDSAQTCASCGERLSRPRPEAARRPAVKPVSTGFYVGSIAAAGLVGASLVAVAGLGFRRDPHALGYLIPLLLGQLAFFYTAAVSAILWYKAWRSVQDGHARTSAARAVGLLFVPFFNLYWLFEVYWGFARDYNAFIERHGLELPRLPAWLFLASCVLTLVALPLAFVSRTQLVSPFVSFGVWIAVSWFVCSGVNRLARIAVT